MASGGRREEIIAQVDTFLQTLTSGITNGFNLDQKFVTREVLPIEMLNKASQLPCLMIFDEGVDFDFEFEQSHIEATAKIDVLCVVQARTDLRKEVNKATEDVVRKLTEDLTLNNLVVTWRPLSVDGIDVSMAHDFIGFARVHFSGVHTLANTEI